jgi:hypothetical protein
MSGIGCLVVFQTLEFTSPAFRVSNRLKSHCSVVSNHAKFLYESHNRLNLYCLLVSERGELAYLFDHL